MVSQLLIASAPAVLLLGLGLFFITAALVLLVQAIEAGNYPEFSGYLGRTAGAFSRLRSRRRWWFNLPAARNANPRGANLVS